MVVGPDYYRAIAGSLEFPTPDTGSDGRFQVENGCLIFISSDGERFLPVFPMNTVFSQPSRNIPIAVVKGREVHVGRSYTVKGGAGQYRLDTSPLPTCPEKQFLVGGIL